MSRLDQLSAYVLDFLKKNNIRQAIIASVIARRKGGKASMQWNDYLLCCPSSWTQSFDMAIFPPFLDLNPEEVRYFIFRTPEEVDVAIELYNQRSKNYSILLDERRSLLNLDIVDNEVIPSNSKRAIKPI